MRKFLIKKYYGWRFLRAYKTLERQYQRHRDAGHDANFSAVDESSISFFCVNCPELQPLKRKGKDVVHITVDSNGRPKR